MKSKFFVLILGVMLVPNVMLAQDISSISGSLEDEAQLVITGSGFGSKDHGPPLRWLDFNEGNIGSNLDEPGWNLSYDNDTWCSPHYSNENMRDGTPNGMFCGERSSDGYLYQVLTTGKMDPVGTKLYIHGSIRFDWGNTPRVTADDLVQIKTWRIFAAPGTRWEVEPGLLQENTFQNNGFSTRITNRESADGCPELSYGEMRLYHPPYNENQWNQFQIVFDMGDLDAYNGHMSYYLNGKLSADNFDNHQFRCGANGKFDNFMIGNYLGNAPTGRGYVNSLHYDDIYVDDTWQRVEIGNAPVYDDCTHREIQLPETWDNGSITLTANRGAFQAGQKAYVFVVDQDNNASSGYEITWGGELVVVGPGQPTKPTLTPEG